MKKDFCKDCSFVLAMWGKLWCGIEGQVIKPKWKACKHFKRARNFEEKDGEYDKGFTEYDDKHRILK